MPLCIIGDFSTNDTISVRMFFSTPKSLDLVVLIALNLQSTGTWTIMRTSTVQPLRFRKSHGFLSKISNYFPHDRSNLHITQKPSSLSKMKHGVEESTKHSSMFFQFLAHPIELTINNSLKIIIYYKFKIEFEKNILILIFYINYLFNFFYFKQNNSEIICCIIVTYFIYNDTLCFVILSPTLELTNGNLAKF